MAAVGSAASVFLAPLCGGSFAYIDRPCRACQNKPTKLTLGGHILANRSKLALYMLFISVRSVDITHCQSRFSVSYFVGAAVELTLKLEVSTHKLRWMYAS